MLKGVIIENSLADTDILKCLVVEKTWQEDAWTLHAVRVSPELVPELSRSLAEGPWYIHLWEPGTEHVTVIFQNAVFTLEHDDKFTWQSAIRYGLSLRIPREQLDFPID